MNNEQLAMNNEQLAMNERPASDDSFVGSLVRSCVGSLVRWFVGSLVRWFVRSFVRSFLRSFVPSFLRSTERKDLLSFSERCAKLSFLPSFLRWWLRIFVSQRTNERTNERRRTTTNDERRKQRRVIARFRHGDGGDCGRSCGGVLCRCGRRRRRRRRRGGEARCMFVVACDTLTFEQCNQWPTKLENGIAHITTLLLPRRPGPMNSQHCSRVWCWYALLHRGTSLLGSVSRVCKRRAFGCLSPIA